MKIEVEKALFPSLAHPKMSVVATCGVERVNAIALAWHTPIARDPPLYGISVAPQRYSYELIKRTGEFALNFLSYEYWDKLHYCGTHSGRVENKIECLGLKLKDCTRIKTKMLAQAYANMECTLFKEVVLGDHTLFVGRVVAAWVDDKFWNGQELKVEPIYQLGSYSYTTIDRARIAKP